MASSSSLRGKGVVVEPDEPDRVTPKRNGGRKMRPFDLVVGEKLKRTPQRGMGVAQLERLRLMERDQASPEMGPYYSTPPLTPDPAPIQVLEKYPPGFGPNGYEPSFLTRLHGNVVIPSQFDDPIPLASELPPPIFSDYYLGSRKSTEVPLIQSPVYKKIRMNGAHEFMGFNLGNENISKARVMEHQFFPSRTELMGEMELGSSIRAQNDDQTVFFNNDKDSIDLSLKL